MKAAHYSRIADRAGEAAAVLFTDDGKPDYDALLGAVLVNSKLRQGKVNPWKRAASLAYRVLARDVPDLITALSEANAENRELRKRIAVLERSTT